MEQFKYLIIGGGIAGTTAAETIRQNDSVGSIAIVSDEPYPLYSRVMLSKPNFFLGKIAPDKIYLKNESWYKQNNIAFLSNKKAVRLDRAEKIIALNNEATIKYGKLLVATGARTKSLVVPGSNKQGVLYLRTLDDAKKLLEFTKKAKHVVAIGGGIISFEVCSLLRSIGATTTLIIRESYYAEPILDEKSRQIVEQALEKGGVNIIRSSEIKEITGTDFINGLIVKNDIDKTDTKIDCDAIIVGIGVIYNLEWLKKAGLGTNKGILVNEYLETNRQDIWAAGDVAEFDDVILGEKIQLCNWINALTQGKIVGLNMAGIKTQFRFISTYITHGFDIDMAFAGDTRPLQDRIFIQRSLPHTKSHIKFIVKCGKLIGATLINKTDELSNIVKIIEKNMDIAEKYNELADPNFDLKQLLI